MQEILHNDPQYRESRDFIMRVTSGGALIDRSRRLKFSFDGRRMTGHPGDTLASALLANGVLLVGRSFKYHRPRGIMAGGVEEANALVTIGEGACAEPNTRATAQELYEGLVARSQNAWPNIGFDLGAITGIASRFLPAGFYYKTFFGSSQIWTKIYEPWIRKMAGLGPAPKEPDLDVYDKRHAHCEVLIIGGGAAGRLAAEQMRNEGRVILIDENSGSPLGGVHCLHRTTAFGLYDNGLVMAAERLTDHLAPIEREGPRQRLWQIRAKRIILATGAHQQPLIFPGNDIPGVMLADAGARYLTDFGVLVGKKIILAGGSDALIQLESILTLAGATVCLLDVRIGSYVTEAHGRKAVTGATVIRSGLTTYVNCDAILMDNGWQPALHLYTHVGGRLKFDEARQCFLPIISSSQPDTIGACAGEFVVGKPVPPVIGPKAFVDFQNDVTVSDLDLAAREGFLSVEHLKRYTTNGMATDQGKTSNLNAIRRLADYRAVRPETVGTTTFRPPYTPVTFGALAGHDRDLLIDPERHTPMHEWHLAHGAIFEDVGQWKRPRFYPRSGETMHDAVVREGIAVRSNVGLFDASTLGKIDIQGPDAATFLNLVYTNAWLKLDVGRCRYGVMLGEDGMVFDDGVTARLGEQHFIMFTTTGNAARVLDRLEDYLQTEWTHLNVTLTSVTEHWAASVVTGPNARALLEGLVSQCDLTNEAFPHLAWREGYIGNIAVRLYRISFTGELSFEVHCDARFGQQVWDMIWDAGRAFGATSYGTENMHVLRAEKGYIIIGQETDGTVGPNDLGLAWAIAAKKPDFIGKRSLARAEMQRSDRKQLVGLLPQSHIPEGGQVVGAIGDTVMLGHVTSSYWSPALDKPFALALVSGGRMRIGQTIQVRFNGHTIPAKVVDPVFYDIEGSRMSG